MNGNGITDYLKNLMGKPSVPIIILVTAILLKFTLFMLFSVLEGDKLFQVIAGRNLVLGNGLTYQYVSSSNLSVEIFEPLNRWPPAYSLLFAFLYSFIKNEMICCLLIDAVAVIIFLVTLKKILHLIHFPPYVINLILLFFGAVETVYIFHHPTDLLTLGVFLIVLYWSMMFSISPQQPAKTGYLLGVLNFLPFFLRYLYLPSTLLLPLFLVWAGFKKKDKRMLRGGINAFAVTIILSAGLLLFQKVYAGHSMYIMPAEKGIFWSNLLTLHPALVGSFINIDFTVMLLKKGFGSDYTKTALLIQQSSTALFCIAAFYTVRFLIRKKVIPNTAFEFFVLFGILSGAATIAVLSVISFTRINRSPFKGDPYVWTFLSDARYYLFIQLFIFIMAAYFLFLFPWKKYTLVRRTLQIVFLLLVTFEVSHTFYFIGKRFDLAGYNTKNIRLPAPVLQYLQLEVNRIKSENKLAVLSGASETIGNRAVLMGAKGMMDHGELNSGKMYTQQDAVILVILAPEEIVLYEPFRANKNVKLEKEISGILIYSLSVKAGH